jgi:hypothetical protein
MSNTTSQPATLLKVGDATSNDRPWGTFNCIGTAYGDVVASFTLSGHEGANYTVVVPANLEKYVVMALENKWTTLVSFDGGIKSYATITDILIYN